MQHISLNFEASEKIDNTKMQQIAIAYMELIGFGDQPYLVYRHNDIAHQHTHIATTSIQRDGKNQLAYTILDVRFQSLPESRLKKT
ncbi:relaxase/mobilization nuclease domain-containing protein [Pedobacter sp. ASV12]|uniref:relaxase/mobilization nuclease domain-containing protein n=1 Tax=Pedobacter sp. ASV12 TaxID=2795120 RepID=UPI00351C5B63